MRDVGWTGAVVGVVATMLFARLLVALVDSAIIPYLHGIFAVERPGGVTSFSGRNAALYDALSGLSLLSAFPLALFLGGLVVGAVVRSSPGLSGALVAAVGLAWSSANTIALLLNTTSDTPFDDAEKFLIVTVALCVFSPIAILAGYLGGKLGGRLRSRAVLGSAA